MQNLALVLCLCATPALADMQSARDAFQAGKFDRAITELAPKADAGNAEAEFLLGSIYSLGLGRTVDAQRGVEYFRRAAGKGHGPAQLRLSEAYASGTGLPAPDPLRAALWAELAAIAQANGARDQAAELRRALPEADQQTLDHMLQDYRTYLFPFEQQ